MLLIPLLDKFKLYIMGGLTIAVAALTIALYVTSSDLDACKAGRSADRASYQLASAQAEALALRQKHEVEMKYAQVAQQADENFRVLRDRYHANVVRYEAASRASSSSNLPGTSDASSGADRSNSDPVVSIPTNDAMICADNTARLQSAQEWARSLAN